MVEWKVYWAINQRFKYDCSVIRYDGTGKNVVLCCWIKNGRLASSLVYP